MTLVINNPYAPRYLQVWTLVSPCVCSSPYLTGLLNAQRALRHYDNEGKVANATEKLTSPSAVPYLTKKDYLFIFWESSVYIACAVYICASHNSFVFLGSRALYTFKLALRITALPSNYVYIINNL